MSCNAIHEILPSNRLSVAHLPDGKRLNLAEKHEWESDQQVVKTAKLVALLAVFLCGTFGNGTLGVFGLTALWNVCLLGSCHGNLSGLESGRLWILEADVTAPTDSASARNRVGVLEFEIS